MGCSTRGGCSTLAIFRQRGLDLPRRQQAEAALARGIALQERRLDGRLAQLLAQQRRDLPRLVAARVIRLFLPAMLQGTAAGRPALQPQPDRLLYARD